MPEQTTISLSPYEIISIIENNYCDSRLDEVIQILLRVEHVMPETDLLKELLNKNILNISSVPYLKYRFEKYFATIVIKQTINTSFNLIFNMLCGF